MGEGRRESKTGADLQEVQAEGEVTPDLINTMNVNTNMFKKCSQLGYNKVYLIDIMNIFNNYISLEDKILMKDHKT